LTPANIMQAIELLRAVGTAASADGKLLNLTARVSLLTHEIEKTYGG